MQTRSQTKQERVELSLDIDFDYASQCWNQNKIRMGASYKYVCGKQLKNGNYCKNRRCKDNERCAIHYLDMSQDS